ncbi:putative DER1-like family member protein [Clavispora lusitaniae]|uniref:DER1-like family member protein n=1 Tax=Clavispora lusitaniae TaxID=36911 RepID=A0ACD0WKZ7_CLALS|nr:hypothetical protein E0198_003107 [Clavispora lusitaniae]KAF7582683.1 Der1-like family protein [Clavispora lusitaniae]QFZ28233.1 putative DER1-like family member protein [Clavispora lusitaniae]QFZ33896.1 putative DER1-like family member protein [Clavispora lusitaniae]QFZ39580.1 putative DER1-like family member protein [Clavispora lusitaniae]
MSTLSDHVQNIPPVTRFFTIVSLALSFGFSLDLFDAQWYLLHTLIEGYSHESWLQWITVRLIQTVPVIFAMFFVPQGLFMRQGPAVIMNIYFFYSYSSTLERGKFKSNFADYLWFVWVCGTLIVVTSFAVAYSGFYMGLESFMWHDVLLDCITFVYSRDNKGGIINFLGLVPVRCYYLPFFKLAVSCLSGKPALIQTLQGFLIGYLYLCFQSDTLPFYNLVPGCYGKYNPAALEGNRVGANVQIVQNEFPPAIFDLGYWKAPQWVYKLLRYPETGTVRKTAFSLSNAVKQPSNNPSKAKTTGFYSRTGPTFKGKGHRLGS